jgi:hypothetical protein
MGLLDKPRANADAQSYLALVYARLGQKEAALESGRRATENLPASRDVIVGGSYHTARHGSGTDRRETISS